jgi:hypothetical protein
VHEDHGDAGVGGDPRHRAVPAQRGYVVEDLRAGRNAARATAAFEVSTETRIFSAAAAR